jgi:hypothetical protein
MVKVSFRSQSLIKGTLEYCHPRNHAFERICVASQSRTLPQYQRAFVLHYFVDAANIVLFFIMMWDFKTHTDKNEWFPKFI